MIAILFDDSNPLHDDGSSLFGHNNLHFDDDYPLHDDTPLFENNTPLFTSNDAILTTTTLRSSLQWQSFVLHSDDAILFLHLRTITHSP